MEAETRRKVEEMVLDILKKSNIDETTEFTIRVAASERLGIDLSGPETKQFVRTIIESYLLSIATDADKPPQVPPHETPKEVEPPQPQDFNKVVGIKRKNDDSEDVICQVNQSLLFSSPKLISISWKKIKKIKSTLIWIYCLKNI